GFDPSALAPPGARPVLRASSRLAEGAGLMASYLCPGAYPSVAAVVRRALQAQRWQPIVTLPEPASGAVAARSVAVAGEWARPDGTRLTVHLYARADGVVLTFWHRPGEAL